MTTRPTTPLKLFYAYAYERRDERLRNELEKHLSSLRNQGYISDWHNRKIVAGQEWAKEIDEHLNTADIILLLVSPDFMASNYCNDVEVKKAMERHNTGEARVIPVILRPVDWQNAPFGKLQALPGNGKPVSSWQNTDEALYHTVQEIRKVIESFLVEKSQATTTSQASSSSFSSTTHNANKAGLERPATTFLSYAREDAEEVKYLQQQLNVRGVRAWRDVTDLTLGGSNKPEIVYAIEQESDAFVLYVTHQTLASDFIWDVEVPAALSRWDGDRSYHIVPILYGVTFGEMEQHCATHGLRSLKEFNGVSLPLKDTGATDEEFNRKLAEIAKRILEATLTLRLRRVGADRKYEPYLYLRTYSYEPPFDSLDLDLNWTSFFPDKDDLPIEKTWDEILFPALDEVKNVLSTKTPSRKLHMFVQAHLPAAFALGFSFPAVAYFTLLIEGRHGTWSTGDSISIPDPLKLLTYEDTGDAHVAVMELAIARDTASGMMRSIHTTGLSYKHHIRFELPGGPDHLSGVKDTAQALAMSHQIGRELRRLHDKKGVTHIHLFAALPAALAVMVGHQMNALCAITLYHYMEKDGVYVPVCTLGKHTATS